MKRAIYILLLLIMGSCTYVIYLEKRATNIIAVHPNRYTVAILVNDLPLLQKSSIKWWVHNRDTILDKYHIKPKENGGPEYFTVFRFGDGYKIPDKQDRLCFDDIQSSEKCIDKEPLMSITPTRNDDTKFIFKHGVYVLKKNGEIIEEK